MRTIQGLALSVIALAGLLLPLGCGDLIEPIPRIANDACSKDGACAAGLYCEPKPAPDGSQCGLPSKKSPGQCSPIPQSCPPDDAPVCGCDGRFYANRCEAGRSKTGNHNVAVDDVTWVPANEVATTGTWQSDVMTLADAAGERHDVVLRYVFAKDGTFTMATLDSLHLAPQPDLTRAGTYTAGTKSQLSLRYVHATSGAQVTSTFVVESACSDGLRIAGHDTMPNTDVVLHRTAAAK